MNDIPPDNFAMIEEGLYRSSFPSKRNFEFLKRLKLKSILTFVMEDYPASNKEFMDKNGIKLLKFPVAGNKEPFVDIPEEAIVKALKAILDIRNHPMLIHCNKGKHRTGTIVGCVRRVQCWALTSIFAEYRLYAGSKARFMDQQSIELFNIECIRRNDKNECNLKFLPEWPNIEWLNPFE